MEFIFICILPAIFLKAMIYENSSTRKFISKIRKIFYLKIDILDPVANEICVQLDFVTHCKHPNFYQIVLRRCPKTCGLCNQPGALGQCPDTSEICNIVRFMHECKNNTKLHEIMQFNDMFAR